MKDSLLVVKYPLKDWFLVNIKNLVKGRFVYVPRVKVVLKNVPLADIEFLDTGDLLEGNIRLNYTEWECDER